MDKKELKRCWNIGRNLVANPYSIITIVSLLLLFVLILVPFWEILSATFVWTRSDLRLTDQAVPGKLTLFHWARMFASNISKNMTYIPLKNTLIIGIAVSVISILMGSLFAWLFTRTDLPFKKTLSFW